MTPARVWVLYVALGAVFHMTASAQPYSVTRTTSDGIEIIRLADPAADTEVSIAPSIGNIAYRMDVAGRNIFWFPYESVGAFAEAPKLSGNPFLAPCNINLD